MALNIKQNIPLAQFTTFKIGGPAENFVEIKSKEDLIEAFAVIKNEKKDFVILGGGSNVLINDAGVKGLVLKLANDNIDVRSERLDLGAGADLSKAARTASGAGLTGLEWSIGIPRATVGGALIGNAGAFGVNFSDLVETAEVYNIKKGRFEFFSNKFCEFGYRDSIFKKEENKYLVWNIVLKMARDEPGEITNKMSEVVEQRNKKQPKLPSAGCAFKNFTIEEIEEANPALAKEAKEQGVVTSGKVGAGWLIDYVGLKGKIIGDAKVSLEHANFIVNRGSATADEVVQLISLIKQKVRTNLKIQLHEEIRYLGF